jgi:hypothetical protein
MVKIGIYTADRHAFITDIIDVSKAEADARERLKKNNYYGREPQSTVIHFHKEGVVACAGYRHDEYRIEGVSTSTPMNADKAATQNTTPA